MQVNPLSINVTNFSKYRVGNLIYYFYDHETPYNSYEPVKCIAQVTQTQEDGIIEYITIFQEPKSIRWGDKEPLFGTVMDIPLTEELLESINIPKSQLEMAKQLGVYNLHSFQNLCFINAKKELDVSALAQLKSWIDFPDKHNIYEN